MKTHWVNAYDFLGTEKPVDLTEEMILQWADEWFEEHGEWPSENSGKIEGTNENWNAISAALMQGCRGLPGNSSLPRLLEKERGVRNRLNLPDLTEEQILQWADEYFEKHGKYPKLTSVKIEGTNETWCGINASLRIGYRGLPGNSSLPKLLEKKRGVRNKSNLPKFTEEQILQWADEYYGKHGKYPKPTSGKIKGTNENWHAIGIALTQGCRGFPENSSLPKLLEEKRGVRNHLNLPKLTEEQILQWSDEYYEKHGNYPNINSGKIEGTNENWHAIDLALLRGSRGLSGNSSLAKLLEKERGKKNHLNLPKLTEEQILQWVGKYYEKYKKYPNRNSGKIEETNETWKIVDKNLINGGRGLIEKSSLSRLIKKHRNL